MREERASRVVDWDESNECGRLPCERRALSNESIFACCVNEWPLSASWFDESVCNARSSLQDTTQAKRQHAKTASALRVVYYARSPLSSLDAHPKESDGEKTAKKGL
ncbi:hypothetical protein [uncultured Ellagibacter sp.]|uniref:hypothetical protein n=1 Tax=uncultured Ellagibacter sp. TaxID=2137580 RepID=UPI0026388F5E|nr:hypothetical protein [uncultured Ellagibacter sp.]